MKGFRLVHALALIGGLLFLYVPIGILILYSFNASRLVTVWGGFSTQWYASLLQNQALKDAALLSLGLAIASASIATVLGTLAALALERARPGRAKLLFGGLIAAPMVMPEVITGLSLLLLFVALNVERGFVTVMLAHATLTLCFVTMIVQARLATLDRGLEEAAQDLGASPWRVTMTITLPLALPAIIAGWLLAFTLSLDDLVIASFATGPGATTLPMRIYSAVRLGVSPEINAISTLLIAGVAALVVTASLILKREKLIAG
ncbi:MAG: ABC transporter permease subunit [Methylobacterium sp.]|nr:ABC transporter permease subunit [Methylobacterium sp.]MCA3601338.1 ABC transporter permease subunit [Methylobacterium sp.]MCA3606041.1 ABC transporter permease subunit [Methylobacterium sp.]MCA3608718.1 ABC transporter permease subunit [Methylobacterium sp.]MCA3611604.1 ABC transporter permease subunit [Methylobacterium sp.]